MQSEQQTNAPPPSANRARAETWTVRIPNPLVQVHPEAHRHDTALEHTSVRWNAHRTPDRPAGWYVHTTGAEPAPGEPGYGIGPSENGTTGPIEIDWLASFLYTLDGRALAHCREGQGHERMIRAEQLVLEGLLQRLGAAARRYSELDHRAAGGDPDGIRFCPTRPIGAGAATPAAMLDALAELRAAAAALDRWTQA